MTSVRGPGLSVTDALLITDTLVAAQRPVVLAGLGAKVGIAGRRLVELAERYCLRVATTFKGKGVFPEDHPYSAGVFGTLGGSRAGHEALLDPDVDVLLVLGSGLGELATAAWDPRLVAGRKVIQIDADPSRLGRGYPVDIAVTADVDTALADLLIAVPQIRTQPSMHPEPVRGSVGYGTGRLLGSAVVSALSDRVDPATLLFVDNGNCIGWVGPEYRVRRPGNISVL